MSTSDGPADTNGGRGLRLDKMLPPIAKESLWQQAICWWGTVGDNAGAIITVLDPSGTATPFSILSTEDTKRLWSRSIKRLYGLFMTSLSRRKLSVVRKWRFHSKPCSHQPLLCSDMLCSIFRGFQQRFLSHLDSNPADCNTRLRRERHRKASRIWCNLGCTVTPIPHTISTTLICITATVDREGRCRGRCGLLHSRACDLCVDLLDQEMLW